MNLCCFDTHECSSSDCEIYDPCGEPAVGEFRGAPFCQAHLDYLVGNTTPNWRDAAVVPKFDRKVN